MECQIWRSSIYCQKFFAPQRYQIYHLHVRNWKSYSHLGPLCLGHRGFHIINCYGYVGAGTKNPHAFTLNEKFLSSVFEYTSTLGDVPWMVVGDLQTNPDASPVLGTLCASNTKVVSQTVQASPFSPEFGASTQRLSSLAKLERRVKQLSIKVSHLHSQSPEFQLQLNNFCNNVSSNWQRLFHHNPFSQIPPSCAEVQQMCNVLKNSISQEQEMVSQRRINTFKQNLIQDWNSTRKQTYTWVRDQTPYQTPCLKTGVHEYATKHAEIHQMMLDSWSPIFNRFIQNAPPSYDDFLRAFPMALPENRLYSADNPVVLPQITCDDVMALIAQLKPSSPGADAWRIEELQVLGRRSISYLVKFYELVENVGKWPQNLLEVPVASLQKNSGDSPLDIRPISLTSHMYRLWAKLRWQQLQDWHLSWCPDELKGGIAGRETVDAYYQVALEIEHANFTNSPLFGILFDYQKCFDNVAWSIERGILRDLGLPMPILNSMMAFSENMNRRFKLGSSVGPKFGNTNSICQGCPLAILRINSLITAWVHVIHKHPDTQRCKTNAFIDDKNLRAPSFNSLMTANQVTQSFDVAVGAVVNPTKTVVFANTSQGRKELAACEYPTVTDEKLLGASLSFTKKRSKKLANKRAQAYLTVAQRINVCPLNMPAREILLATAGATKFSFGIEMGSCNLKVERTLRSAVARCLWTKGNHKSTDILFSICHKGHLFDPVQLKIYLAFKIARRQLIKHPHIHQLWSQIWQNSATHRGQYRDGRSNMVGPLSNLAIACKSISWAWVEPFLFTWQISETHNLRIPFLDIPEAYFHHLIRFAINQMLWKRASNARKNLRGVHLGIDKSTTVKLLNTQALSPYDKGILKAIFADGITTQKHLFVMKKAAHPVCHFCWCAVETLEHLFWQCPHWNTIRQSRLSVQQITECQQLPLCTQRSGLFLTTANQFQQLFRSHDRIFAWS